MDGGCIDIWRKEMLDEDQRDMLSRYEGYVNIFSSYFSFQLVSVVTANEKENIAVIKSIGYLPEQEIMICGWANVIFIAAEMIMQEFGGYLKLNMKETTKTKNKFKGEWHLIKTVMKDLPDIETEYHLLDLEFTRNYINQNETDVERKLFSLDSIKRDLT